MPTLEPASSSPAGGISLRKLPPWAWALAIAGGAVVGFVFLSKPAAKPEASEEQAPADGATGGQRSSSGAPGSPPIPPDVLESLGLVPPGGATSSSSSSSSASSGDSFTSEPASSPSSPTYTLPSSSPFAGPVDYGNHLQLVKQLPTSGGGGVYVR